MESARDISHVDGSMSAFLVYQYSLFTSIKNNEAKVVMDSPSKTLAEAKPDSSFNYRGAMIAAKTFALYVAGKENAALEHLSDECRKWHGYDATACANHMLGESLGRYYAVHEKLAAVYLYESSYIFERVVPGKAVGGEFYRAMALIEIDNEQADGALKALIDRKQFNLVMAQQYCGFMGAASYKRIIDCGHEPSASSSPHL